MEQKRGSRSGRYRARHAHRPRALILVAALLLLAVAGLAVFAAQLTGNISRTTAFGLKNIGELATQAGYFTTVQTISKSRDVLGIVVPGTQSNYVYSYDGVIKAGIDFEELDISVDDLRHEITIRFPEFRILSTEIDDDSFTLYNDGANLFTSLKLEDVNRSNTELKKAARETAIRNGILENARTNAELLIRGFLAGMYDLSVYTIRFLP
jgi:hypothetical protein